MRNFFNSLRLPIGRTITTSFTPLVFLALLLAWPNISRSQTSLPCSWPLEVTGRGSGDTNVFNPDTDATYWAMAVDTSTWQAMIVTGQYPQSRFFSFDTYFQQGGLVASIYDATIAPNSGSTNPFTPVHAGDGRNYAVTIDGNASGSGNHIQWAVNQTTYVIYRVYVADRGLTREAGVPLPTVTLVDASGNSYPISRCTPTGNSSNALLQDLKDKVALMQAGAASSAPACPSPQPQPDQVMFTANSGGGVFPNPQNIYYSARGLCAESGRVVVIRGKAPNFPNTYYGSSIFQPALPGDIQLRYWSLCNDENESPYPAVDCRADHSTQLDSKGFYTYVIASDESLANSPNAPSSIFSQVTLLRWGDPTLSNNILFREMLPASGFALTGDYFPTGVFCDTGVFISQGWRGCFEAASVTPPQ
jgi:hypothetical protein